MPRYMLAILPPKSISDRILGFQKEIELMYGSIHAQNILPHITVIPPFECEQQKCEDFIKLIEEFVSTQDSLLEIHLDNFQQFDMKTMIVDVAKNIPFENWCKKIKLFFNSQKIIKQREEKHFFVPHITIANKDIRKRDFKLAWALFKKKQFQAKFNLVEIGVLKKNDGWELIKNIKLEQKNY